MYDEDQHNNEVIWLGERPLPAHNHYGVVQRPLGLGHELLGAAAEDDGARLALGNSTEEVKPLTSDLNEVEMYHLKTLQATMSPIRLVNGYDFDHDPETDF